MSATTNYNPIGWANRLPKELDWGSMSKKEFKRAELEHELAHEDATQHTRQFKQKHQLSVWEWSDVWAAAAYANRVNQGYFKQTVWDVDADGKSKQVKPSNRDLMKEALADSGLIQPVDRDTGETARDWLSKNVIMKGLQGSISSFDQSVSAACSLEQITSNDRLELGLIASQIQSFLVNSRIEDADSSPVAPVGTKGITLQIEVVRSVWSHKYNTYYITAITGDNKAVFFSYREKIEAGVAMKILGTVKAHRKDSTQLTRVRRLDK